MAGFVKDRIQSWLGASNDAVLPARQEDRCLSYGLSWLEHDQAQGFRWSRRFFGFYPAVENIREVELLLESPTAKSLTFFADAQRIEERMLTPGIQPVSFRVPRRNVTGARHLGFAVGDTFQTPDDPRSHGIRLLDVRVTAAKEVVRYRAEAFLYNGNKVQWRGCADQFRARGGTRRARERNATQNISERSAELDQVKSTPLKLYVEVTWLCNLRCPSCFQAYVQPAARKETIHFMSPYLFHEIAEKLFPGAAMVWYSGNGETLLHPNIDTILRTSREFTFVPALLTNGTLFTDHNMRMLVEGGFFLSVSVDSPCEKDFERLRAPAKFSKVVGALEHLRDLQRKIRNNRFNLRIQCVAQRSNLHQLVDLVRWSANYDAMEVQFLSIHNYGNFSDYIERSRLVYAPGNAMRELLNAVREGTRLGIRVNPCPVDCSDAALNREMQAAVQENVDATSRLDEYYALATGLAEHPANDPQRRCHMAWADCFLCADGTVAPCCINLDETRVGNLYDEDFWTIWNGPAMAQWRRTVNHDPRGICRFGTCIFRDGAQPALAS
jgi:MoaA/NifB/PqqE/SkfB family radical SAM enzyme